MLIANTSKLVYRMNVSPQWLPDGQFFYKVATPNGEEIVLVNPTDGSRKVLNSMSELPAGTATAPGGRRRGGGNAVVYA